MTDPSGVLAAAQSFLLVDWPTREVPDALALAGYEVHAHGGPGPEDYFAYEVVDGEVAERRVGEPPVQADVVWTFRPLDELREIVEAALSVGARVVWVHSGLAAGGEKDPTGCWLPADAAAGARAMVEGAGLEYLDRPYVAGAVRDR